MILIKLGGSIITNKEKPLSPRKKVIENIVKKSSFTNENDNKSFDKFIQSLTLKEFIIYSSSKTFNINNFKNFLLIKANFLLKNAATRRILLIQILRNFLYIFAILANVDLNLRLKICKIAI